MNQISFCLRFLGLTFFLLCSTFLIPHSLNAQIDFGEYITANPTICSNANDYTICLQSAVDDAETSGEKALFIPAGQYNLFNTIEIGSINISGVGDATELIFGTSSNFSNGSACLNFENRFVRNTIENLYIDAYHNDEDELILMDFEEGLNRSLLRNITLRGPYNPINSLELSTGIRISDLESDNNIFSNLYFHSNFKTCVFVDENMVFNINRFEYCRFQAWYRQIDFVGESNVFFGCTFASTAGSVRIYQRYGNSNVAEFCYFDAVNYDGYIVIEDGWAAAAPLILIGGVGNDCDRIDYVNVNPVSKCLCVLTNRRGAINLSRMDLDGHNGIITLEEDVAPDQVGERIGIYTEFGQLKLKDQDDNVFVAGGKIFKANNANTYNISSSVNWTIIPFDTELLNMGGYNFTSNYVKMDDLKNGIYDIRVSINYDTDDANSNLECGLFTSDNYNQLGKTYFSSSNLISSEENSSNTLNIATLEKVPKNNKLRCRCRLIDGSAHININADESVLEIIRKADY